MPAAPSHTLLAVNALIDELDTLPADQIARIGTEAGDGDGATRLAAATSDAFAVLEAADRLDLFETATQRLAAACIRREIPQGARAAAYSALVGLIASDLLPPATFRTLYQAWEAGLDGLGESPAVLRGEQVVLRIE
jgi:hypothetical protein